MKNIFISHRHEDDHRLYDLKTELRSTGLIVRDSSVYSGKGNRARNENYIRRLLSRRIRWAGTLVVVVSSRTRLSRWVHWEVEHAHRLGKRIVGVWAQGQEECPVPRALRAYADTMVPWDGDQIRKAIEGTLTGWHDPGGRPKPICEFPSVRCR